MKTLRGGWILVMILLVATITVAFKGGPIYEIESFSGNSSSYSISASVGAGSGFDTSANYAIAFTTSD